MCNFFHIWKNNINHCIIVPWNLSEIKPFDFIVSIKCDIYDVIIAECYCKKISNINTVRGRQY